ncbi:MAG: dihydroorotase, partial [Dehalococcoidia bacterium]|nr:dihydroorotase [Dehalococcoidia bacterium]
MLHTCVANGVVVLPGQGERRMDIGIVDGVVVGHYAPGTAPAAATVIDATDRVVVPGLVDPHLHIGLGNGLADWATETRSAAAGGVTSVFTYLMSGDSYLPVIAENRAAAAASAIVDYGFHTVPCSPTHLAEMDRYVIEHGVTSHKYFTSFRGDEGAYLGITGTDDGFLFDYLTTLGHYDGTIANIHPENIEVVWRLRAQLQAAGRDDLRAWDESRPDYVEAECVFRTLFYARQANCPVYIVHISSRRALDEFRAWRARFPSAPVWGETCPHYLTHHRDLPIGSVGKV